LAQSPYTLIEVQYTDQVCFLCGIPTEDISHFQSTVTDVMNGRVVFEIGEEDYVERPVSIAHDEADEGEIE
jgi:putative IMPACT (imprinted ancient) family translation regulator